MSGWAAKVNIHPSASALHDSEPVSWLTRWHFWSPPEIWDALNGGADPSARLTEPAPDPSGSMVRSPSTESCLPVAETGFPGTGRRAARRESVSSGDGRATRPSPAGPLCPPSEGLTVAVVWPATAVPSALGDGDPADKRLAPT